MKLKQDISLGITLFILWLFLSGHYNSLLLLLGLLSSVLVVLIARRMDIIDQEGHPVHLRLFRPLQYWSYLLIEIVKANISVSKLVLSSKSNIRPVVASVNSQQGDDLGRVIYANSITLTPGTVSLEVDERGVQVHALDESSVADLNKGEMDRRVSIMGGVK